MRRATQCARPWNVQGLRIGQGVPLVLADWDLRDRVYNTVLRYVRLDFFPAFKPDIHAARQSVNLETSIVGYNILHDQHVQQGAIHNIIRHSLITMHCLTLFLNYLNFVRILSIIFYCIALALFIIPSCSSSILISLQQLFALFCYFLLFCFLVLPL